LDRERGSLVLVDLAQRQVVRRFEVHGELHFASPTDLPWIAADASLVGAPVRLTDGKELLTVWDGATGQELHGFEVVRARCVAFSGDGTLIAAAGDDGDVRVWSLASGSELGRFKNDGSRPLCLAFGLDGRRRESGDGEGRGWRLGKHRRNGHGRRPDGHQPRACRIQAGLVVGPNLIEMGS
jgi:WD40 repeat protein